MTATEQSRSDALADAETLRRALFDGLDRRCLVAVLRGRERAHRALHQSWPSSAGKYAAQSARAIFRAVPGLRGVR